MLADQLHGLIRLLLADVADGGGAEDDSCAVVTGRAERLLLDHAAILRYGRSSRRSASRTGIWRLVLS